MLGCIGECTNWVIVIYVVFRDDIFILRKSNKSRKRPLGFRCAKMGLAYLEKGRVVIIPYLWSRASSTVMSSFRLIGVGRL